MCAQLGGRVEASDDGREFGRAAIKVVENSPLFDGILQKGDEEPVWMSHGDRVVALPPGFKVVAVSGNAPFAAIADESRHFYGEIGRAHVCTPVTNAHLVCRLLLQKK